MKKTMMGFVALLALILCGTAWGSTTTYYYAALKAAVASGSTGMGLVYAGTSTTAGSYATESTSSSQSVTSSTATKKTFYAFAQPGDNYEFDGWTAGSDATIADASVNPATVTVLTSTTGSGTRTGVVYANFKKKTLAAFDITFAAASGGSYTVDGATPANKTGLTEATSYKLASSDENFYSWTINGTEVFDNPYTGTAAAATTVSATFLTSDQCATAATYAELTAALANSAIKKVTIASGTTIEVASGQTLTVGKKLVVDGQLNVLGTVSNTGVISGNGKVVKVIKNVSQTDPITPSNAYTSYETFTLGAYGSRVAKYCKTTLTAYSPSVSGTVSCTVGWGVKLNGGTVYTISGQDPTALTVTFDTTKAINYISGISGSIDSVTSVNQKALVLFKNLTLTFVASGYKGVGQQGTIDCCGYTVTTSGQNTDSHLALVFVNGSVSIPGGSYYFQNGVAGFINCSSVAIKKCKGGSTSNKFYFFDCGTAASPASVSFTYYSTDRSTNMKWAYFYSGCYNYSFNSTDDSGKCFVYGGSFMNDPTDYLENSAAPYGLEATLTDGLYVVDAAPKPPVLAMIGDAEYTTLQAAVDAATAGAVLKLNGENELTGALTIASDKQLTIDLNGYNLLGGSIVNAGTLRFEDNSGQATLGTLSSPVTNTGTIDITYGIYAGMFTINGGTLTTHNGTFTSAFAVTENGGKVVFKGGTYAGTITVPDGYRLSGTTLGENNKGYINANNPIASATADFSWTVKGLPDDDQSCTLYTQYKQGTTARESYTDAEWDRIAELRSSIEPIENQAIEAVLVFDRVVAANTVNGVAKIAGYTKSLAIDDSLSAGDEFHALIPMIEDQGYTAKSYKYMFDGSDDGDWETLLCGVKNSSIDNIGTTCTLKFQLRRGERASDYTTENQHYNYYFTDIATDSQKFVGQGAIYGATDYASLAAALEAANYNGTVKLSKDCSEAIVVSAAGSFEIDPNTFTLNATITAGDGYVLKGKYVLNGKTQYVIAAKALESMTDTASQPAIEVDDNWVIANVGDNATPEQVVEKLQSQDEEKDNGLKVWQNKVLEEAGVKTTTEDTSAQATVTASTSDAAKPSEVTVKVTVNDKVKRVGVAKIEIADDGAKTIASTVAATVDTTTDAGKAIVTVDYAAQPAGVYQPTVVVESNGTEVEIPDPTATAVEVVKNTHGKTQTVVTVPFAAGIGGGSVTVASLVDTSSLADGDTIKRYNTSTKVYDGWTYDYANRTWEPIQTSSDAGTTTPGAASDVALNAGDVLIVERTSVANPVTLVGEYTTNVVTSIETAQDEVAANAVWNLVANPDPTAKFDLEDVENVNPNDVVIVPTAGIPRRYTRTNDGWAYTTTEVTTVTVGGKEYKVVTPTTVTDDTEVDAGAYFWYISSGTKGTKFEWKK